jgi:diguanylate cyclase (GGDEF)-like protein/PAS domain S-box-containing protein
MTNFDHHLTVIVILLILLIISAGVQMRNFRKIKASEELWKYALEGAGDGVWDWDIENDIAHLSDKYKEILGFTDEDIQTSPEDWNNRIHSLDIDSVKQAMDDYWAGKTEQYIHEHRIVCKDKSIKWVLSRGKITQRDKNGKPQRMVGTHTDITARKLLETQLENLAHYDALTNLPNRTLLEDRLKLALAYAKRENKMLAVMFVDLDLFKEINDLYGHEVGDLVLKQVALRLSACIRESDTVARLGGDEFIILLPMVDAEGDAVLVANKIVQAIALPIITAQASLHVTASIGIAIYPQHGADEKLLMLNADMAMYQSKRNGKNRAQVFDANMHN